MIRAIFFDFDGVLTVDKSGSAAVTSYLARHTGLPLAAVRQNYYRFNKQLLLGEITHADIWADFCRDLDQPIPYQLLIDAFTHTMLDEKMTSYARELRKSYKTGLITDNKCDRIETILRVRNLADCFDVVAVSAALHAQKDQPAIFQYALDQLHVQADECIFIDNTAENLIIPQAMGMETILFDDQHRDFEAFKKQLTSRLA